MLRKEYEERSDPWQFQEDKDAIVNKFRAGKAICKDTYADELTITTDTDKSF